MEKAEIISTVCSALTAGRMDSAVSILERDYPFVPELMIKRRFRPLDYTRVFIRDGFVDRYTGERPVFPPVLRVLSRALPERFPYHPNWKTQVTHPAYWELSATIDHVVPITRGGVDEPSNWLTTSMARNSAKMNWKVEELGWRVWPPGDFRQWDGLIRWFLRYVDTHPEVIKDNGLRLWLKAGREALMALEGNATHPKR
jgi:5-methylcytosine-specific restriction endonuclease McrA